MTNLFWKAATVCVLSEQTTLFVAWLETELKDWEKEEK